MKKNKGLFLVLVALLAVTCLLVSCNSEVTSKAEAGEGKLVYATFGNESKATRPTVSSMTQSYSVDGIDDVYWVYTATKDDAYGTHGQQTSYVRVNETKGLAGAIGPFSKGYWNFSLKGYKYVGSGDDTTTATTVDFSGNNYRLVFVGSVSHFLLSDDNTASTATPISVTVYLQTDGGAGTLTVSNNFKFFWADDATTSSGDLKLKVYLDDSSSETILADLAYNAATTDPASDAYYSLSNAVSNNTVTAGDHTLKAKVVRVIDNADMVYFEGTLPVKIYSGQETVVDMNLLEGQFVWGEFNGTVDLNSVVVAQSATATFESNSNTASFTTSYTPASNGVINTAKNTTVTFSDTDKTDAAVKEADGTTYNLGVTVANTVAAESKFVVESTNAAVAAIDLNLTKTVGEDDPVTVTSFGDNQMATITTYITAGLTNVVVKYNGTGDAAIASDSSTTNTAAILGSDSGLGYNSATGYLSFKTSHFSEYYVEADRFEALNVEKAKVYSKLANAMAEANVSDTVVLFNDVDLYNSYSDTDYEWGNVYSSLKDSSHYKTISDKKPSNTNPVLITCNLDLNGYTIEAPNFSLVVVADGVKVNNGNIVACYNGEINKIRSYAIVISKASNVVLENLKTVGGISFGGSWSSNQTLYTTETPYPLCGGAVNATVKNCDIYTGLFYGIIAQTGSSGKMIGGNIFAGEHEASSLSDYFGITNAQFVSANGSAGTMQRKYIVVNGTAPDWGVAGQNNSIVFEDVSIKSYSGYSLGVNTLSQSNDVYNGTAAGITN